MQCHQHPAAAASAACTRCDALLCSDCVEERRGKRFCAACATYLDRRDAQWRADAAAPPAPAVAPAVPVQAAQGELPPSSTTPRHVAQAAQLSGVGETGEVYQGPGEVYQGPGEVYQGPGEVYQGPGEIYQGPGEIYQAPPLPGGAPSAGAPLGASPGAMVEDPNLPRAAVVGLLAAVVGMGLWYALAVSTGLRWGAVAMLIGLLVGIGTAWGAGRRGDLSVVVMSVAFYAFALIGGQYMIHNHFYQQDLARWAEAETVEDDGDYTLDETRLLLGIAEDEWQEMSQEQREFWRGALEAEYADEMLGYEDEDLISPEGEGEEAAAQMPASLPLGEFLGRLPAYIGVFGFIFLAVGGFEAFKFAAGSDS